MYTIDIAKQCGCFRDSDIELPKTFASKIEAELEALRLANRMNGTFCKKHRFFVTEKNGHFTIDVERAVTKEPKNDEMTR